MQTWQIMGQTEVSYQYAQTVLVLFIDEKQCILEVLKNQLLLYFQLPTSY